MTIKESFETDNIIIESDVPVKKGKIKGIIYYIMLFCIIFIYR